MTLDAGLTLGTIAVVIVLLIRERILPALAVFGGVVFLLVTGVITPAQAFQGFSNPAPFTVAALYLVARAVEKTGGLRQVVVRVLGDRTRSGSVGQLLAGVSVSSAFLNNTPIVAMLTPEVTSWASRSGGSASSYLMPLSFAAILGGTITAIGTSTTLVVSGLLESHGQAPVGIFEIARFGLPLTALGLLYLVFVAPRLLPDRRDAHQEFEDEARAFTIYMRVDEGGPLDGVAVEDAGLAGLGNLLVARLDRGEEMIAPVTLQTVLRGGDRLAFVGAAERILDLQRRRGLSSTEWEHLTEFHDAGHTYFEAVVGPGSPLLSKSLKELGFRERFDAVVLGVHRAGEGIQRQLSDVVLRSGDTLLLLARADFADRWQHRSAFLLVARLGGLPPTSPRQSLVVGAIVMGVVGLAATGVMPILHASLLGVFAVLGTRILAPHEAFHAIDMNVVVLIAAAFGLGNALETTGLASAAAHGLVTAFSGLGAPGVLFALVAGTLVLTEVVTNNATAVLIFPIALSVAVETDLDPRITVLVLAVAASCSFLTPIGYQTNTMVYGPGGYRFSDYTRVGLPLTVMVAVLLPWLGTVFGSG